MSPHFRGLQRIVSIVLLMGAWVVGPAAAQSTFGSLIGTITDPSGAVVPGATVTITNSRTQAVRTAVTAADGSYLVSNLDAGRYEVVASLSGFADVVREATLLARQTVRVDSQLNLQGASEQVQVTAAQPVIESNSATTSSWAIALSRASSGLATLPMCDARNCRRITEPPVATYVPEATLTMRTSG